MRRGFHTRSPVHRESPVQPAKPGLGSTLDASLMPGCHGTPCPAFSGTFGVKRGLEIVGPSVYRTDTRRSPSLCPRVTSPVLHRYTRAMRSNTEQTRTGIRPAYAEFGHGCTRGRFYPSPIHAAVRVIRTVSRPFTSRPRSQPHRSGDRAQPENPSQERMGIARRPAIW